MNSKKSFNEILLMIDGINRKFVNKPLKNISKNVVLNDNDKGAIGKLIETELFDVKTNNSKNADLDEIEIKVTGLKRNSNDSLVAKERLVFSMINFEDIKKETFNESHFWTKNNFLALVFYEYDRDKPKIEWIFKGIQLLKLITLKEIKQIEDDYNLIRNKVLNGLEDTISSSDTVILEACPKGSKNDKNVKLRDGRIARRRAFAFKSSFVTKLYYRSNIYLQKDQYHSVSEVINKILEYKNKSVFNIIDEFKININFNAKQLNNCLVARILNVNRLKDLSTLAMENTIIRVINLESNNALKEHVPLIRITKYDFESDDIDNEEINENEKTWIEFENSELYSYLNQKIIFVIFKKTKSNNNGLKDVYLHDIKSFEFDKELIEKAKIVYEDTMHKMFKDSVFEKDERDKTKYKFIKSSDKIGFHIRPKARDSKDVYTLPNGETITKQAFWLNNDVLIKKLKIE